MTGTIDALGIYMFGLVFFWTPPHFWALSLLIKDDYVAAQVPMLPVVTGESQTGVQIVLYIALLIALAWLPLVGGYAGPLYAIVATALGLEWLRRSWRLARGGGRPVALDSYKFSLFYLFGAFFVLALEAGLPWQ